MPLMVPAANCRRVAVQVCGLAADHDGEPPEFFFTIFFSDSHDVPLIYIISLSNFGNIILD